jgi:hypothetical protein
MLFTGQEDSQEYQSVRSSTRNSTNAVPDESKQELRMDDFVKAFKRKMENAVEKKDFSGGKHIVIYECVSKMNFLDFIRENPSVDRFCPLRFSGRNISGQNDPDKIVGRVSITKLTTAAHARTVCKITDCDQRVVFVNSLEEI